MFIHFFHSCSSIFGNPSSPFKHHWVLYFFDDSLDDTSRSRAGSGWVRGGFGTGLGRVRRSQNWSEKIQKRPRTPENARKRPKTPENIQKRPKRPERPKRPKFSIFFQLPPGDPEAPQPPPPRPRRRNLLRNDVTIPWNLWVPMQVPSGNTLSGCNLFYRPRHPLRSDCVLVSMSTC